jgi:peptide chain release factor 1
MKFNLDNLVLEYEELENKMTNPEIFKDQKKVKEIATRKKFLTESVSLYKEYKSLSVALEQNKEMLYTEKDEDMRELIKSEVANLETKIPELEEKLKFALLPKDPNDDKNIIIELRAGTGGEEAALFAAELAKSYMIFAENEGFKVEISEKTEAEAG